DTPHTPISGHYPGKSQRPLSIINSQSPIRNPKSEIRNPQSPIPDYATPAPAQMRAILDTLDDALAAGHTVYLHCHGGKGRTGTVVGCWLVRHGMAGDEALAQIAAWRAGMGGESPETEEQREMVRGWRVGIDQL
ncbi:MAG: tyrosine-protein phosphatase, partial [Anaerolineales bacterium]